MSARRHRRHLSLERARLAELNKGIAEAAVRTFVHRKNVPMHRWPGVEWDDAIAVGHEALCKAAVDWRIGHGGFASFAYQRVWFAVIDWLRQEGPIAKNGRARQPTVSWVDDDGSDQGQHGTPTDHLLREEQLEQNHAESVIGRRFVLHALSRLEGRERYIMHQRLVEDRSMEALAEELGISLSRVRQLQASALAKLRRDDDILLTAA